MQKYPNDAVQYEGEQLSEAAESQTVTLSPSSSQQNIKAACSG
ncbi:hypothetical protein [Gordonia jacobaea]